MHDEHPFVGSDGRPHPGRPASPLPTRTPRPCACAGRGSRPDSEDHPMTTLQSAEPRHALPTAPLRIAMLGTRGVPAAYGGFETAIEEIGQRLVDQGHEITVYGRSTGKDTPREHLGMRLVNLPALHSKTL